MDGKMLLHHRLFFIIDCLTQNIEDTSQSVLAYRHRNGRSGSHGLHAADQTVSTAHGDTSHRIITQMLGYLSRQAAAVFCGDLDRLIDLRQFSLAELDIQNRTDDLCDLTNVLLCHLVSPFSFFHILCRQSDTDDTRIPRFFCPLPGLSHMEN